MLHLWLQTQDAEGNAYRESNARLVRWSDDRVSIVLGDEVIDCDQLVINKSDPNHSTQPTKPQASDPKADFSASAAQHHLYMLQREDLSGLQVLQHHLLDL